MEARAVRSIFEQPLWPRNRGGYTYGMLVIVAALALILSPSAKAGSLKFEKEFALAEIRAAEKNIEFSQERDFQPVAVACEGEKCGEVGRTFPAMKRLAPARDPRDTEDNINVPRVSILDEMEKIMGASRKYEAADEEERARR